ncbi:hypothetical protein HYS54_01120 [Candidatus Micrarchaeota archaeon]|nr:hypothetical protein [Candidatus Micrarchaeota archaeon]
MQEQQEERLEAEQAERQMLLRKLLDTQARERLTRLRLANPRLAERAEAAVVYLYQAGQVAEPLSDGKLRSILERLAQKRETRIVRK